MFLSVITLTLQISSSLEIFCKSIGSLSVLPSKSYRVSIENPPNQTFFVIGKDKLEPILSYESKTWKNFLDFYSLASYKFQLPYYYIKSNSEFSSIYFSVCSFHDYPNNSFLSPPEEVSYTCEEDCGKYHSDCVKSGCNCENDYIGKSCGLKYHVITSEYSETFDVEAFSMTFFYSSTGNEIKFEDKEKSSQGFWAKDFIPSFFQFDDYEKFDFRKEKVDKYYFTVFCSSEYGCKFKVESGTTDRLYYFLVIGLPCILFIAFSIICLFVLCKVKLYRKNNSEGAEFKEVDKIASLEKIRKNQDSCSICLNGFKVNEKVRVIRICKHFFHSECIEEWLAQKAVCPNCKLNLN